jgi:hypothetical protein
MATMQGRGRHTYARRVWVIGDARVVSITSDEEEDAMPDDTVTVNEQIAVRRDRADLPRLLGALNPVLERVVQERLEHPQDPQLKRNYSRPHAEGSWDHTG